MRSTNGVDVQSFSPAYLDRAERVFLQPSPRYLWKDIVSGASVRSSDGGTRRMSAVGQNTFRGFHRRDKTRPGAKAAFIRYFLERRGSLLEKVVTLRARHDLNHLCNHICDDVRVRLTNCSPTQLTSYNKVRKPVDLYIEHLVAMAVELDEARARLVPWLFLPLDRQILAHPGIFTAHELAQHGLSRTSTYKDVTAEETYAALQLLLANKAAAVARARHRPFHVIWFDLVWNDRYRNCGGNLFESNR